MKCIDDEIIQKFIDGETDERETNRVSDHLATCSLCVRKVEAHRAFAETIKKEFGKMGKEPTVIPPFIIPTVQKHKRSAKIWYAISAVAAACAIFAVFFLRHEREESSYQNKTLQMQYGFDGDFDSNKTVSQQEMTIIIIDACGKVIDYNEL